LRIVGKGPLPRGEPMRRLIEAAATVVLFLFFALVLMGL
jgi:hypothetical protein